MYSGFVALTWLYICGVSVQHGGVWRWGPTQEDGNGDGSGDGNESSNGDGNGDEDGNGDGNENGNGDGNEDEIGEGGRAAMKRKKQHKSCRRHGWTNLQRSPAEYGSNGYGCQSCSWSAEQE